MDYTELLEDIKSTLSGIFVFSALVFILIVFICLIIFFEYYDKCKEVEKEKLRNEIKKELNK